MPLTPVTQASPQALVLSVKSMGAHILRICILYIRCPALVTALNRTVCTVCTLEYNPVLCTQILVSLGSTINTGPQQIVSINLAGEVKGGAQRYKQGELQLCSFIRPIALFSPRRIFWLLTLLNI